MNNNTDETNNNIISKEKDIAKQIQEFVNQAYAALKAAEDLAKEHGSDFSFNPAYGMGGTFFGTEFIDNWGDVYPNGWQSSSQSC